MVNLCTKIQDGNHSVQKEEQREENGVGKEDKCDLFEEKAGADPGDMGRGMATGVGGEKEEENDNCGYHGQELCQALRHDSG